MDGSWFCYVLRPTRPDILQTGPTPEESALTARHWDYTLGLFRDGRLALAGRTTTPATRSRPSSCGPTTTKRPGP
jgi:hypothetical protein